MKNIIKTK